MFTDIVGYTALMAESEEKGLGVRRRHREVVRPLVERYAGEWIEAPGDESLSTFHSALDAVNCALAVQAQLESDPDLKVHVGIHLGDVVIEGGEISGEGVNVAARICPLSEPGGVCVSGEVYKSIRNHPEIDATSLGAQELKNVPEPVAVYSVTGTAAEPGATMRPMVKHPPRAGRWLTAVAAALVVIALGTAWWLYRHAPELAPIRSIAVLPLENLSGDPKQEYFADGMTEALIGDLAKIGSLRVISRTSVMQYKRAPKPLPEIARELNVDGIVEGAVMRDGDRVRITAQLIDASDDRHLWSDRYDRDLSDVLALQSDVARAIAEQIRLELTPEEQVALTASRTVDPRAYDAYLRGVQLRGPLSLVVVWGPRAIEQFELAVELDPRFAEGYRYLARTRADLGIIGFSVDYRSEFPKARDAARRALELDERQGGAHAVLGQVRLWYDWDFPGAGRAYRRALQLSPSDPSALSVYAWYLLLVEGRTDAALELSERLLRVAPFDLSWRAERLKHFVTARRYERALEEVERVRELDPDFVDLSIGGLYGELGRFEEAHRAYVAVFERCGALCDSQREAMVRGWAEGGWEESWRAWLEIVTAFEGFFPATAARTYALIGETDQAFAWLERGYRERDPQMIGVKADPSFDPIRSDPRFNDLLRRIGFPES
jgi:TolB-like protein